MLDRRPRTHVVESPSRVANKFTKGAVELLGGHAARQMRTLTAVRHRDRRTKPLQRALEKRPAMHIQARRRINENSFPAMAHTQACLGVHW